MAVWLGLLSERMWFSLGLSQESSLLQPVVWAYLQCLNEMPPTFLPFLPWTSITTLLAVEEDELCLET